MGADNGLDGEVMAAEKVQDAIYFLAGVHHQRFARERIADDGTIALQHPHGDGDVNQSVMGGIEFSPTVAHARDYNIPDEGILGRRCMDYPPRCHHNRCYPPLCCTSLYPHP